MKYHSKSIERRERIRQWQLAYDMESPDVRLCERLLSDWRPLPKNVATVRRLFEDDKMNDPHLPPNTARKFQLRKIEKAIDLAGALDDVLTALSGGNLTIREAAIVHGILETRRKTLELIELSEQMNALERKIGLESA